jgi:hypothetical protein
MTRRLA